MTVRVDNESGAPAQVTVLGTLLNASCTGGASSYGATASCAPGLTDCLTVTGLRSGIWRHEIGAGSQSQATKSLLIAADPNGTPNGITWVVFKSVLSVDRTDDVATPTAQCPSPPGSHTCTLRRAIAAGATAPAPLLVRFDPTVFPAGSPTTIQLTQATTLPLTGYQMTVDGTDTDGNPSFRGDPYNRIVALPSSGATFAFRNQLGRLIGLSFQRPTLDDGATPGDIIRFDGTDGQTQQNAVVNCKIDGGGGSLTLKSTAHDCIEAFGAAGLDWSTANSVSNCEISGCPDKGAKCTTQAYLRVEDSWVHHNIGGGIQATQSGNVEADRNVIELNGYNASAQVFTDANGLAANGANVSVAPTSPDTPSVLHTDGNLLRANSSRGISVQELSTAQLANDFSCGATNGTTGGQNGIAIFNTTASAAAATVRGVTAVYNGRNGATIANQSTADFGQDSSDGGHNAFTQNATNAILGGHNFDTSGAQANIAAVGNQWQHCYANPTPSGNTCDGPIDQDINGVATWAPPEPFRQTAGSLPVIIDHLTPTKAQAGDLVRIIGGGFNAIDPYPIGGNCTTTVQANNTCSPRIGNCVQVEASPGSGQWLDLPVQAVTPTEIVVQLPPTFACAHPVAVRVQRLDATGTIVTGSARFCTNS